MSNQDPGFPRSEVMQPAPSNNGAPSGSMVPLQQPLAAPSMAAMGGGYTPAGPEILHGPLNQTWLINCLRRRWLLALLMGMLMGAVTAGCLLLAVPEATTVAASLRVSSKSPPRLGKVVRSNPIEVEMYAQTQLAMLKSNKVLKQALERPSIAELDAVRKEGNLIDAVQWLTDELRVSYRNESEILEVRFSGNEDAKEMVQVVDAVLEAFIDEVIHKELIKRDKARVALGKEHRIIIKALAKKRKELETLQEGDENIDSESENVRNRIRRLERERDMIRQQQDRDKLELVEIEVAKLLAVKAARSPSALDSRVQEELATDPTIANYEDTLFAIDQQLGQLQQETKRETPNIKKLRGRLRQTKQEMERYQMTAENKIRQRIQKIPGDHLALATIEYGVRRRHLDEQAIEHQRDYQEKTDKLEELGRGSPILDKIKIEIEQLQDMDTTLGTQLRMDKIDQTAEARISISYPATALGRAFWERYAIAVLGGVLVFGATCYCVAFMEFQRRRLNQPSDMEEGLGIRVLGALPSVASRKALAAGSPIAAQVSESIDNVRATLLHDSTSKERQVILITSPVTMEGSTTVASHLAVSLSRAGRRILLIDGDLRQPSLHKLFGLPLDGGFSEVLRSELDVADAVRPTTTEGLWLLTAGLCDMDTIHALATDQPQPIFEKLREEFDFIIIDGAPVLGLSDMLSLGQHVDGAILTVLRDHSEIRKVYQAAELLKSMDIRLIGSVVNGVPQKMDRRITNLHQSAAKRTPQLPAAATTTTATTTTTAAATVVVED